MIEFGNFFLVPVNYLAVLLSAVSNMVVGFLWYGPLYGKEWRNLVGFNKSNQKNQKEMLMRLIDQEKQRGMFDNLSTIPSVNPTIDDNLDGANFGPSI